MKFKYLHIASILLFVSFSQGAFTQVHKDTINTLYDHEIGFDMYIETASVLNNALLNASGFIDEDLKDENQKRLNDVNQGGSNIDLKFFYRQSRPELWGVKKIELFFALEWHYLDEYRFTDDLYNLVFYGNKDYAGKAANLSYTGRQYLNYYQLKSGIYKLSLNEKHWYGANIALNLGNQFSSIQLNDKSCLNTNSLGTEIQLNSNLDYAQSDTNQSAWYQMAGLGASVDLFYKFQKKDYYSILISAENIGFIRWNKNTISYSENKTHSFSGIEVDNIFDMSESLGISDDTLMDYVYENAHQNSELMMLPIDLRLKYKQYFMARKIELSAMIYYRVFSYMLPLYQIDATYEINKNIKLGPILSYGGYTAFNAGLKLEFTLAKNYHFRLESRYITGFAQHYFSGMGGFINFTYKI